MAKDRGSDHQPVDNWRPSPCILAEGRSGRTRWPVARM